MPQFNLHLTPEFEKAIDELMRLRRIRTKSDAVRVAVMEAVERERRGRPTPDFSSWLGLGRKAPENPNPRFRSDDDLWS
ncbi:MAG TPA: ribbon-helix-helix domain-containing protein [Thermoanaerobaculia bacterium]|nr:ribbon-helix-helix domain-containing protein [Thermoanaerobaculia bacterium]